MSKNITTEIVNDELFQKLITETANPPAELIDKILKKALRKKGLSLYDVAILSNCNDEKLIQKIFATAGKLKKEIYGERIVLFAPLYVSDFCVNDCEYCGFHVRNKNQRKKLTLDEVAEQTKILAGMGHKRLLLEFGEHPTENPIDYVVSVIKKIYATKNGAGEIRRVNVNIAATTVANYRKLKKAGIGTYQLFQETYHRPTFERIHRGPKADYERQLFAHDRAFEAGIDDLGIGVLFGLYDWHYEILALLSHAQYMEKNLGVGPHTISFPRIQPALTVDFQAPFPVSENELLKIIAILRLAVPYTGMIISTRESAKFRQKAFELGISQTSAASRVGVGEYQSKAKRQPSTEQVAEQFIIQDERSLEQVVEGLAEQGLLPSFCTACYRSGRTGDQFMPLAKSGKIHNLCRPNAILTFKEYLLDFASPETQKIGQKIIKKYLKQIPVKKTEAETIRRLERLEKGERDLYF